MPSALNELAWSGRLDSNQRPDAPEAPALPTALRPDYTNLLKKEIKNGAGNGTRTRDLLLDRQML